MYKNKYTQEEFEEILQKHNNNLKLISEYIGSNNKVTVIDNDDIEYSIKANEVIKISHPTLRTAIDKTKAYNIKLSKILPNFKIIEEYTVGNKKALIEDNLGIKYMVKPESLLLGRTPSIITAINKNDAFKKLSINIHGDIYNYDNVNYIGDKIKVDIYCKYCDKLFEQRPNNHLGGQGCPYCASRKRGWSKKQWLEYTNGGNCTFYIIECSNDTERFIKFGITSKSINARFIRNREMPYKYNILHEYINSADIVWDIEKKYGKKYIDYKYTPCLDFKGKTECYNIELLNDCSIFDELN